MGNFAQIEIDNKNKWIYFTKKRWIAHVIYWISVCIIGTIIRLNSPVTFFLLFNSFFLRNLPIACFFYTYCLVLIPYFFKRNKKTLFWVLVVLFYFGICAIDIFFSRAFVKPDTIDLPHTPPPGFYKEYLDNLQGFFFNFLFFSMMLFFMEKNEENATILELEKEKRDIEQVKLDLLKTNISPDFLIRSLKQLKKSAVDGEESTPQAILTFSDLMRYRLYRGRHRSAPLAEEIMALQALIKFIELETGNHLMIGLQITGIITEKNIAPLALVNMLEILCKTNPAQPTKLNIGIWSETEKLRIEIDYHASASGELFRDLENYGINYKQLYGEDIDFEFENCKNNHCQIKISLLWLPDQKIIV